VPLMRRQSLKPIICRELHRRHAPGRSTDKPALPGIRAYPLRAGSIPARLSQGLRSQQIPSCKHRSDTCIVNGSSGQNLSRLGAGPRRVSPSRRREIFFLGLWSCSLSAIAIAQHNHTQNVISQPRSGSIKVLQTVAFIGAVLVFAESSHDGFGCRKRCDEGHPIFYC
jgi:hypothetical protein